MKEKTSKRTCTEKDTIPVEPSCGRGAPPVHEDTSGALRILWAISVLLAIVHYPSCLLISIKYWVVTPDEQNSRG